MAINLTTTAAIEATFPPKYFTRRMLTDMKKKAVLYPLATKYPMPAGNGKTMQARKSNGWDADTTPLEEGVTPDSRNLSITEVLIPVRQYGDWVQISDFADKTAFDNLTAIAADELTELENNRLELLNVNALKAASNAVFAASSGTPASAAYQLTPNHVITSLEIRKAVRDLKKRNAKPFVRNGKKYYMCVVNADSEFALQNDPDWKDVSKYQQAEKIENGEIGKLYGAIVVVSPFPIEWTAPNLLGATQTLTVKTGGVADSTTVNISEALSDDQALALKDRYVIIGTNHRKITAATAGAAGSASLTVDSKVTADASTKIYPGEAGAQGAKIHGAAVFGDNAFGNTDIDGSSNLSVYYNPAGGATDPLHQRKSVAVKIMAFGAGIVDQSRLVMIKHGVAS